MGKISTFDVRIPFFLTETKLLPVDSAGPIPLMDKWICADGSVRPKCTAPLDMTHTQPSMALVRSAGEEALLNQVPAHK